MFIDFLGGAIFHLLLAVLGASGFWSLAVAWAVIIEGGIESFSDFFCRVVVFVFMVCSSFTVFISVYYLFKGYWGF